MSFVETEIHGQILTIRLNRPERLNTVVYLEFRVHRCYSVAPNTGRRASSIALPVRPFGPR